MRNTLLPFLLLQFVFLCACHREDFNAPNNESDPVLKKTITKDTLGRISQVTYYNNMKLVVTDSLFSTTGISTATVKNEYNSAGKTTRTEYIVPSISPSVYLWLEEYTYQDDTLMLFKKHSLKGNQTALTKYFYTPSRKLILDSTYHTGLTVTTTTKKYTYDAQGRLLTDITFNGISDTTLKIVYQYNPGITEQLSASYSYEFGFYIGYSKTVTAYTPSGKILSEQLYSPLTTLYSQKDYTYDGTGRLLKITAANTLGVSEERYIYNSNGQINRVEGYIANVLVKTKTYYYE